jgi:hypothetical protein
MLGNGQMGHSCARGSEQATVLPGGKLVCKNGFNSFVTATSRAQPRLTKLTTWNQIAWLGRKRSGWSKFTRWDFSPSRPIIVAETKSQNVAQQVSCDDGSAPSLSTLLEEKMAHSVARGSVIGSVSSGNRCRGRLRRGANAQIPY